MEYIKLTPRRLPVSAEKVGGSAADRRGGAPRRPGCGRRYDTALADVFRNRRGLTGSGGRLFVVLVDVLEVGVDVLVAVGGGTAHIAHSAGTCAAGAGRTAG